MTAVSLDSEQSGLNLCEFGGGGRGLWSRGEDVAGAREVMETRVFIHDCWFSLCLNMACASGVCIRRDFSLSLSLFFFSLPTCTFVLAPSDCSFYWFVDC